MSVLHSFGVEIVISGWWLVAHSLSGGLGGFHVAWLAPFTRWATCLTTKHWTVGVTHMTCTPHLHCMPSHLGLLHSWTRLPAWPWNIEQLMLHTSPAFCVYMSSYFSLLHSVIHTGPPSIFTLKQWTDGVPDITGIVYQVHKMARTSQKFTPVTQCHTMKVHFPLYKRLFTSATSHF